MDVHGHSLSVYNGTGSRRQTAHDVFVRKIADIMVFAGLQGVDVEDANSSNAASVVLLGDGDTFNRSVDILPATEYALT